MSGIMEISICDSKTQGFYSSLPLPNNKCPQFIGIHDNCIYISGDTGEKLKIYKKVIVNSGDWKLIWSTPVQFLTPRQCHVNCNGRISVCGLTASSILILYGTGTWMNPIFKLIKLNLKTMKETEVICNFANTDFFIEHLSEICNECQNSKLKCRNFDDSSIILTHFKDYLTIMAFDIDFDDGEIGRHKIKFIEFNLGAQGIAPTVAINSEGVVAVMAEKKLLCAEFKSDDEYHETTLECDELSDLPQFDEYTQTYIYSDENDFKCLIWYENETTHKCFNISRNTETNKFTLLKAKQIPSFPLPFPFEARLIFITSEYFFCTDGNDLYTFVGRMLSLSELAYIACQEEDKRISVSKLKKRLGLCKYMPLVEPPKCYDDLRELK